MWGFSLNLKELSFSISNCLILCWYNALVLAELMLIISALGLAELAF